jgi:D-alanyl-D-alanine carboxypeptidase (penicillin-binding protein 5/6)
MRRYFTVIVCLICLLIATPGYAAELPTIEAASYYLVEPISGEILAQKNADERRAPASMTKMMTGLIIFEKLHKGELSLNDTVTVSKRAAAINEAEIRLVAGEKITIKELLVALFVQSANDAAVAIAEHIAGSEEEFVALMNKKAEELGLKNTHFQNSSGLNKESYPDPPATVHDGEHVMSAEDTSIVARHLLENYPEVLTYTKIVTYTFHEQQPTEQKVKNWNQMLPTLNHAYEGVDGLKTGHTNAAGYCFAGTAQRNGMRLVSVVMGTSSENARFQETKKLLNYGFDHFTMVEAITAGKPLSGNQTYHVPTGVEEVVAVAPEKTLSLPQKKDEQQNYSYHVTWKEGLEAPINKGTVVGEVQLLYNGEAIPGVQPVPLVTQTDVERASSIRLFFRSMWKEVNSWVS